ncbi:sensor histidine kinase [Bacteroidota bacterium]
MLKKSNKVFKWSDIKYGIAAIVIITFILSIFDYHPNTRFWLTEILRNFILCVSIGLFITLFSILDELFPIKNRWTKYTVQFFYWTLGGILGALLGWFINDLIVGFRVTNTLMFLIIAGSISLVGSSLVTTIIILKDQVKIQAEKLSEKEISEQKLKQLKTKAELEALRSKVNPHFFFNTLNSIASLIPKEPKKAEGLIENFSNLFRYPFLTDTREFVKLKQEIDFIKDYLEIEKTRLGDRLDFNISLDNNLDDFLIPGMIIQPIVENSIIHGLSDVKIGGKISITCTNENKKCIVKITDNGKGFNPQTIKEGFGIKGVKERLNLIYGNNHMFHINSNKGVEIIITIPGHKE